MPQVGPLSLVIAGAALLDGSMHMPIPAAAWIGLLLILHGSRSMPALMAAPSVWLASAAIIAVGERDSIPSSGVGYFALVLLAAFTLMLPFAIDRAVAGPSASADIASTLLFPVAFVAVEFLRSRWSPNATWGSIAYTQYGAAPLMQIAAYAGIWGIIFLMTWSASTLDLAWRHGFASTTARAPLLAFGGVFAAAIVVGSLRVGMAATDRPTLRAATLNRPADLFIPGEITRITEGRVGPADRPSLDAKLEKLHDWFLGGSRREARAGARLVVWPEQSLLVFKEKEALFLARARQVAAEEHLYLAMGMGTIHLGEPRPFENKLVLIEPTGRTAISYLKNHPVPGWEASIMRPGDGRLPVAATPDGRMAAAICHDASFPEFVRQAAAGAADLLILPVNDWKAVRVAHFQMHAFRAIETGIPIVRAAASGISGAFDPWGRVLGFTDFFAPGDRSLTVQLPVGGVRTMYARIGDALGWLCVAVLATALVTTIAGRTRSSFASAPPSDPLPVASSPLAGSAR
jgi:apolipoprotein N-acyltransferase